MGNRIRRTRLWQHTRLEKGWYAAQRGDEVIDNEGVLPNVVLERFPLFCFQVRGVLECERSQRDRGGWAGGRSGVKLKKGAAIKGVAVRLRDPGNAHHIAGEGIEGAGG